jgi:hypothetical protein
MVLQTKRDVASILADIEGDKRFFCQDGYAIRSLTELVDRLNHMAEEVFHHHVTSEKNDFSNWVRDVLGDEKLASKLRSASNPLQASKIVTDKVTWLQRNRNQYRRYGKRT